MRDSLPVCCFFTGMVQSAHRINALKRGIRIKDDPFLNRLSFLPFLYPRLYVLICVCSFHVPPFRTPQGHISDPEESFLKLYFLPISIKEFL